MDEALPVEPNAEEADGLEAAIRHTIVEIDRARAQMQRDREEIDRLKADIKALREETRAMLDTFKTAA